VCKRFSKDYSAFYHISPDLLKNIGPSHQKENAPGDETSCILLCAYIEKIANSNHILFDRSEFITIPGRDVQIYINIASVYFCPCTSLVTILSNDSNQFGFAHASAI